MAIENKNLEEFMWSLDEQEVILRYDPVVKKWEAYANVSSFINTLVKVSPTTKIETVNKNNNPSSAVATLEKNQVIIRKVPVKRELTVEQRIALTDRLRKGRENQK